MATAKARSPDANSRAWQFNVKNKNETNKQKKHTLWEIVACWSMAEGESEAGACHLEAKDGSR